MKAVGFFYDWSGRRALDPYFRQVAQAFAELGIALDVVLADEFRHPDGGQESTHPAFASDKLVAWVRQRAPDVIFSVNNAGLTHHLLAATDAPVVVWLVDDLPHLFFHDGFGHPDKHFAGREQIFCYSSTLVQQIADTFPHARDRTRWMPHGTNSTPEDFISEAAGEPIPIGFVGSCLPPTQLLRLLGIARAHRAAPEVLSHLAAVRADYVTGSAVIQPSPALSRSLAQARLTLFDYQRLLADASTTQNRAEALTAIAGSGLNLWGNAAWLDTLVCTPAIAESFRFDSAVTTPEELNRIYARSRISVNIPNVQNCAGLAVRVFDAMASPSLLITEHHPESDLHRLFGPECPVPMYRDAAQLRQLCAHYLAHEDERLEVVAACNRLIDDSFALRHRIRAMLAAADVAIPTLPTPARPFRVAPVREFRGMPRDRKRLPGWAAFTGKRMARAALDPLLSCVRKQVR